jgi:6-phosphogluconolactonase
MPVTVFKALSDPEAVAEHAAGEIASRLREAAAARSIAHLAVSGGTTPGRTYELLAASVEDWDPVELWFVDERGVGPGEPESNYGMVRETLLSRAPLAAGRVHRMEGELGPERAASDYSALLRAGVEPLEDGLPVLDVVVLGIGPDGHVASLFPDSPALEADVGQICLAIEDSPKPPPQRVTLSLPVLRAARCCLLLATGSDKAHAVARALGEPSAHVPASLLERERLIVLTDPAAARGDPR